MKEKAEEYLQSQLDKGGFVYIEAGTYVITKPLYIKSNTELVLAPDAVFKLADGANCAILENASLNYKGEKRDKNISVRGGIWDGNNSNQVRRTREERFALTHYEDDFYYGILMRFVGIDNFHISDMTVKDPDSYAMLLCATDGFTVENINLDYNLLRINMDGIHIQGPSRNGSVKNIRGTTNDDLVALNCDDTYACEITRGNIENVLVDGLYSENGYTGVRLLSSGSKMKNVCIRNVFGTFRYYGVSFTHHSIHKGEPVWFDNILLDGIFVSKPENLDDDFEKSNPIIWFESGIRAGSVTIRNVFRTQSIPSTAPTVKLTGDIKIGKLTIDDVNESLADRESFIEIDKSCIDELNFS